MNERNVFSITARERLRNEIAEQTEEFLRRGGHIDRVRIENGAHIRPVAQVWQEMRGGHLLAGH